MEQGQRPGRGRQRRRARLPEWQDGRAETGKGKRGLPPVHAVSTGEMEEAREGLKAPESLHAALGRGSESGLDLEGQELGLSVASTTEGQALPTPTLPGPRSQVGGLDLSGGK